MDDTTSAAQLFERLLRDPALTKLTPLRGHADLRVRSVAVNRSRVDVVATTADDEWRVVFGTTDMITTEWVHVFTRPPQFDGVPGGRALVVNGPSSSGKSTLLGMLRDRSAEPWVIFDEPMFGGVRSEYLIWQDRAPLLHTGFLNGIAALAHAGNLVALAAGGRGSESFRRAFAGLPTLWVGLDCPADERQRREATRLDVPGGLFAASPHIHDGWEYDLRFDTTEVPLDDVVRQVLERVH
jgi:chloramphenicol 3-O phosphotransferase